MLLRGRKIALGVSGGIAAYKTPELVRLFVKAGAEVRVVMTSTAADFVTAKTLSVVSRHETWDSFFTADHRWNNHVELGEWADLLLIAPLTANTLAKMCAGQCDNILLATYLSSRGKVAVAPAMDLEMYRHPTTTSNLGKLKAHGVSIIPAATGELASGLVGEGRMSEPEQIFEFVVELLSKDQALRGKKALVNAGPTYEAIDPVRFIGNRSSGKMGIAIAEALREQGADVTLVLGPTDQNTLSTGIEVIRVETANEMHKEMIKRFDEADVVVACAAVADYKPAQTSTSKLKKSAKSISLELEPTVDVLSDLGKRKDKQVLAGFALETDHLLENARKKLQTKNLDFIVANGPAGLGAENNEVTIIGRDHKEHHISQASKRDVAKQIVKYICAIKN